MDITFSRDYFFRKFLSKTFVFGELNKWVFGCKYIGQTKWRMCKINELPTFRYGFLLEYKEKTSVLIKI